MLGAAGVEPRVLISCQSATGLCEMVTCGLGISIVNPLTASYFQGRGLQIRRFFPRIDFRICAIRPLDRPRHDAGGLLIELLRIDCSRDLAGPATIAGGPRRE